MRIELKCKCGSIAIFQDDDGIHVDPGSAAANVGREFVIKVCADEWQDRHRRCYEGVPMVLSEAMAHGIIPVVSEFVGLKAEGLIINEHNALVFPVGDTLHAVDCVERIIKNQEFAQTLSLEAMKSITGIYTLEGTMATWAKSLYECSTKPQTSGSIPKLKFPPDGRLAHFGLPPWILQRIRDVFGKPHIHADGGV